MRAPSFYELGYVDRTKILRAIEWAKTRQIAITATADGCWQIWDMNKKWSVGKVNRMIERDVSDLVGMYRLAGDESDLEFRQRLIDDLVLVGAV